MTNPYEAALNRLIEERMAVRDIREAILVDEALRAAEPEHRRQLLSQTLMEVAQLTRAIEVLTRLAGGETVEVEATPDVRAGPVAEIVLDIPIQAPVQDAGLIRRFVADRAGAARA